MTDLIPQDLIQFVEANRPEVLPDILMVVNLHAKTKLQSEHEKIFFLWNKLDGSHYRISDDHAAALLEHWLFDAIKPHIWYADLMSPPSYVVCVGEVTEKNSNKLSALWEAYKRVKGSKE